LRIRVSGLFLVGTDTLLFFGTVMIPVVGPS
jgi:hypothetical protein